MTNVTSCCLFLANKQTKQWQQGLRKANKETLLGYFYYHKKSESKKGGKSRKPKGVRQLSLWAHKLGLKDI